ncbi:MAG: 23S rRNA (pseudouridine(1915)-N(3))-methyltransferase RlmH [bacterium]|nr:23S rRNA (pseudouridine(1915)-N(3))-methyltransferase RlmH [bacterium]
MKVRLLTLSQRQPDWVAQGEREYSRRLPREWGFEVLELKPAARSKGTSAERVKEVEAERVQATLARYSRRPLLIALDERGSSWSTTKLADRLGDWQGSGRDVVLLIGGADGLAKDLLTAADERWSLSPLTLPHGLVRIVVVEQLYRAVTIRTGHPYHRS